MTTSAANTLAETLPHIADNQPTQAQNKPKTTKKGAHLRKYSWKPGESGNPKGRPSAKYVLSDCLRQVAKQKKRGSKKSHMQLVALALFERAEAGNVEAAKLILERLEGKPPDSVHIAGTVGHVDVPLQMILDSVRNDPERARALANTFRQLQDGTGQ